MPERDIFWKNIKTLYAYKSPKSQTGYELRIGRWVVDGRDLDLVLAKQEFKETDSGLILWGKIKGLGASDLYRIFSNARVIADLMSFPLPADFPKQRELDEAAL